MTRSTLRRLITCCFIPLVVAVFGLTADSAYSSTPGLLPEQQAYLKASNTGASDYFGYSVAISGDTMVVGAYGEDSSVTGVNGDQSDNSAVEAGAAYIYTRSGGVWTQQAYLKASNTGAYDYFGWSVAISGDTVVVGAYGEDSSVTGVNGDQSDNSAADSGAAYIYTRSGGVWTQQAYLKASNTGGSDYFGYSVAISGDTVVVGAYGEDSSVTGVNGDQSDNSAGMSGAAYTFTRSGSTWTQQAYLKASNTGAYDYFGWSVAISGDTVVVGAYGEDSSVTGVNGDQSDNSAADSGAAYIYTRSGGVWTQQAYLKASNTDADDLFGRCVAISGDTVVVGAHVESSGARGVNVDQSDNSAGMSGAAYIYTRSGGVWTQQAYLKASNTDAVDLFGYSVAISVDTIVVGAQQEDSSVTGVNGDQSDNSAAVSGAAYTFTRSGSIWTQEAYLKASSTGAYDYFGKAVAVAGDTVVVGASNEDSSVTGVNGDQSDNSAADSGAAYAFAHAAPTRYQQTDTKLGYAGTWVTSASGSASGGSLTRSNATGSSVTVKFTGTYLAWITVKSSNRGIARIYLDGVNKGTVDLYKATTAWQQKVWETPALTSGTHTVRIEYTGTKNASSTGTYIDVDAFDVMGTLVQAPRHYEQTDTKLGYAGTWVTSASGSASGGSLTRSNATGSSVTVKFTGTYLAWITVKSSNRGIARIYLDGVNKGTVDLYKATTAWQQKVWETPALTSGTHTVRIEYTGTKNASSTGTYIDVDAFDVMGTLVQAPRHYEQTDTKLGYAGTWVTSASGSASGGSLTRSNATGSSVTVKFTGTYLAWITVKSSNRGIARIYLDGVNKGTVDLYKATTAWQQKVWETPALTSGTHTVRIEYTGTKNASSTGTYIDVDAFDVIGTLQ